MTNVGKPMHSPAASSTTTDTETIIKFDNNESRQL